jgi:hypothetical protein
MLASQILVVVKITIKDILTSAYFLLYWYLLKKRRYDKEKIH